MKNTRLLKVIPQILLLSVFALSSCGNQFVEDKCINTLKNTLEDYRKELSPTSPQNNQKVWSPPQKIDEAKFKNLKEIDECKSSTKEVTSDPKPKTNTSELDSIKRKYEEVYSDLNSYILLANNFNSPDEQQTKLKKALALSEGDTSEGKIVNHNKFINYTINKISEVPSSKPASSDDESRKKLSDLEKSNATQNEEIKNLRDDLADLKANVFLNSLFNLLILTGILGSLGYFIFSKINTNKPDSLADKKRKSRSGNLGAANPKDPANQGSGNTATFEKRPIGKRGMGASRPTRNSPTDIDEDFDERPNSYREPDSGVGYQQQKDLKFRLNKPAQNRGYIDSRDFDQQDFSDLGSSNINPPSLGDNYGQTYLPQAKVNRGQLTENLATQYYQSKSYTYLEACTVGYYSATPESVARNRSDSAKPLDLVEFFDGLFWIVNTSERNLLFPNPRMRIEQTRIRGIEYFFETNYSDENYHSCTLDAPAYVEFVNGKWVRIKKGRVTFAY